MNNLLKRFWEWISISYEEYAIDGISQSSDNCEDDFPLFSELLAYAESIVKNEHIDNEQIDDLLTIMALDNETEYVLDLIESDSSEKQIHHILICGIAHPLYEARWQLAELIYRRKPDNYLSLLQTLSNDAHPYVQKRAINCINRIMIGD
ncbi:MAG: hypothetical protein J6V80_03965 [Clostridia bacterium]|nr:hypothetical protein [Clostridia bacterium]